MNRRKLRVKLLGLAVTVNAGMLTCYITWPPFANALPKPYMQLAMIAAMALLAYATCLLCIFHLTSPENWKRQTTKYHNAALLLSMGHYTTNAATGQLIVDSTQVVKTIYSGHLEALPLAAQNERWRKEHPRHADYLYTTWVPLNLVNLQPDGSWALERAAVGHAKWSYQWPVRVVWYMGAWYFMFYTSERPGPSGQKMVAPVMATHIEFKPELLMNLAYQG